MANEEDKKSKGWTTAALVGGFILFILIIGNIGDGDSSDSSEPDLSPREEMIREQFSSWDGSHRKLVEAVKDRMHDPSSFEHVETRFRDDDDTVFVQMEFRGTNALGGTVTQMASARTDPRTGEVEWLSIE